MLPGAGRSEQQQSQDKGLEAKPAPQRTVVALKGQLLHWRLLVANSGQPSSCFLLFAFLGHRGIVHPLPGGKGSERLRSALVS